jgi:hypothetical protein
MGAGTARSAPPYRDRADEAMTARAHERFAAERRRAGRRSLDRGALPNLIVIGGLKCGTTSLHHYLSLHPDVAMSRPKELNFFIAELNWELGRGWYASHFDPGSPIRGESSPHYTNRPRFEGVAERMRSLVPEARIVYVVRDPIERLLSHYLHNLGGSYDPRPLAEALADDRSAYWQRSRYAYQVEPYVEAFGADRVAIVSREELKAQRAATMRKVYAFCEVDPDFASPEFEREWETGSAKGSGGFRLLDRAVRLPGLRALDRNFDRLPERLRWRLERAVHDPDAGASAKPELPPELRARMAAFFGPEVDRLEQLAERSFEWML